MVKIEAVIQPFRLDQVKAALDALEIDGISIWHVLDHNGPKGLKTRYRGSEYYVDVPKVKLEMLVSSHRAEEVMAVLAQAATTGGAGDDGTIVIYEIADAIRIRNGRRVEFALL